MKKTLKLNFSHNDQEGFTKAKHALTSLPWPVKDNSVDEISCIMRLQYVGGEERDKVMDEMYRVLKPGSKVLIAVPYYSSKRAIQDGHQKWPPFCEESFLYFNKAWREMNHPERKLKCDFKMPEASDFNYQVTPEVASRNDETRMFFVSHYVNTVNDMLVTLTKAK